MSSSSAQGKEGQDEYGETLFSSTLQQDTRQASKPNQERTSIKLRIDNQEYGQEEVVEQGGNRKSCVEHYDEQDSHTSFDPQNGLEELMCVLLDIENLVDNKPAGEGSINQDEFKKVKLENEELKEKIRLLERSLSSKQNEIDTLKMKLKDRREEPSEKEWERNTNSLLLNQSINTSANNPRESNTSED